MTEVSELGDLSRFANPRQLMAYLGLVPSEASSGSKRRQGAITKTGNGHARWMLIECASHYRMPPKVSPQLSARQGGQSREVKAIAWRAQERAQQTLQTPVGTGDPPQQGGGVRRAGTVRVPLGTPPPDDVGDRNQSRGQNRIMRTTGADTIDAAKTRSGHPPQALSSSLPLLRDRLARAPCAGGSNHALRGGYLPPGGG